MKHLQDALRAQARHPYVGRSPDNLIFRNFIKGHHCIHDRHNATIRPGHSVTVAGPLVEVTWRCILCCLRQRQTRGGNIHPPARSSFVMKRHDGMTDATWCRSWPTSRTDTPSITRREAKGKDIVTWVCGRPGEQASEGRAHCDVFSGAAHTFTSIYPTAQYTRTGPCTAPSDGSTPPRQWDHPGVGSFLFRPLAGRSRTQSGVEGDLS